MSDRKAARQARRAKRKQDRQERKAKLKALVTAAENAKFTVDLDSDPPHKFITVLHEVWPVLEPVLDYVESMKITGDKTDEVIAAIIALGNQIKEGGTEDTQNKFVVEFNKVWKYVNMCLGVLKAVVNDKADEVIDDIIDVGDWLTANDGEAS